MKRSLLLFSVVALWSFPSLAAHERRDPRVVTSAAQPRVYNFAGDEIICTLWEHVKKPEPRFDPKLKLRVDFLDKLLDSANNL